MRYEDIPYSMSRNGLKTCLALGTSLGYADDPNLPGTVYPIQDLGPTGGTSANPNWFMRKRLDTDGKQVEDLYFKNALTQPHIIVLNFRDSNGTLLGKATNKLLPSNVINGLDAALPAYRSHLRSFGYTYDMAKKFTDVHFGLEPSRSVLRPHFGGQNINSLSIHKENFNSILVDICSDRTMVPRLRLAVIVLTKLKDYLSFMTPRVEAGIETIGTWDSGIADLFAKIGPNTLYNDMGNNGYNNSVAVGSGGQCYTGAYKDGVPYSKSGQSLGRFINGGYGPMVNVLSMLNGDAVVQFGFNLTSGKMYFTCYNREMKVICDAMDIETVLPTNGVPILHYDDKYGKGADVLFSSVGANSNLYANKWKAFYSTAGQANGCVRPGLFLRQLVDHSPGENVEYVFDSSKSPVFDTAYVFKTEDGRSISIFSYDLQVKSVARRMYAEDYLETMKKCDSTKITDRNSRAIFDDQIKSLESVVSKYPRSYFDLTVVDRAILNFTNFPIADEYANIRCADIIAPTGIGGLRAMPFSSRDGNNIDLGASLDAYSKSLVKEANNNNLGSFCRVVNFSSGESGFKGFINPSGNLLPLGLVDSLKVDAIYSKDPVSDTVLYVKSEATVYSKSPIYKFTSAGVGIDSYTSFEEIINYDERFNIAEVVDLINSDGSLNSIYGSNIYALLKMNFPLTEMQEIKRMTVNQMDIVNLWKGVISSSGSGVLPQFKMDESDLIRFILNLEHLFTNNKITLNMEMDVFAEAGATTNRNKATIVALMLAKLQWPKVIEIYAAIKELFTIKTFAPSNSAYPFMFSYKLDGSNSRLLVDKINASLEIPLSGADFDGFTSRYIKQGNYMSLTTEDRQFGGLLTDLFFDQTETLLTLANFVVSKNNGMASSIYDLLTPLETKTVH